MSEEKKSPAVRPYHVIQNVNGQIMESLVIASSEARARNHATRNSVSVRSAKPMDVVALAAKGIVPQYATDTPPEQISLDV